MNPTINTSLQTNVQTGSSAPATRASSNPAAANQTAPEGFGSVPSLCDGQSSTNKKVDSKARFIKQELYEPAESQTYTLAKNTLEKLLENRGLRLEIHELADIIQTLFFSKAESSTGCFMHQIYTNKELNELIPLFESGTYILSAKITNSTSNILPSLPEGSIVDLNTILDTLCEYLTTLDRPNTWAIIGYVRLCFLLSAYYEAPVANKDFAEYSKTRIAKLEKLMGYPGPWTSDDCSLVNDGCIFSAASLFKFCKQTPSQILKIKQDFACWLMTSFNHAESEGNLLLLDFMKELDQASKLRANFDQKGIDFDKEFLNDPNDPIEPIFVFYILRADSKCFVDRIHLLQNLERLGLKPENISKHHPILELALELKDPELLRHLIVEYKFNPYYISDTTGYSVWQILTQQKHNYSDKFQRESASILNRYDIKYYSLKAEFVFSNEHVDKISLNEETPKSFEVNLQNQWGETALIRAAKFGYDAKHLFAFKELDLTVKDNEGKTALGYAKENNNQILVSLIRERQRPLTTVNLIQMLGVSGPKDNYQRLIAFVHKKSIDNYLPIEKAYQTQNILFIEAIEAHLPAISLYFGDYVRTQEGKSVQPLALDYVLDRLRPLFAEKHPEALTKLRLYTHYYYCMQAYIGLSDEALNAAIHGLIGLIPDVHEVDTFSQDVLGGLINLFAKISIETQTCKDPSNEETLYNITKKAYKNVAHWLLSPVLIKSQSRNAFMISFLNASSIRDIHLQREVKATKLNLQKDFFNSLPFLADILSLCKQNLSGYRANPITILKTIKELALDHSFFSKHGVAILHLALRFEETSLFKYLILEESLNPFMFNKDRKESLTCAAYCRNPEKFSSPISDSNIKEDFRKVWMDEIEPVLLKRYVDLPPHSPKNPRIDLIAQGKIPATLENINLKNQWGETPLIFATKYGYPVEGLLEIQGIDIQAKDQYKKTALAHAKANQDLSSQLAIENYAKKQAQTNQVLSTINKIYQNTVAHAPQPTNQKLSARQIKKAEQAKKQEQAEAARTNNKPVNTPIAQRNTQKPTPPAITITIPELLEQHTDNFVYQEPPQEPSYRQKAKEQIAQTDKKPNAKKNRSLLGRVVSGAKELKATLTTAAHIVKNPSQAGKTILQNAAQRLATTKEVSTRVEAQDKPLLGYPNLLELLDLAQAQDCALKPTSGVKKTLKALDAALDPKSKNVGAKLTVRELEAGLSWAQSADSMALTQRGSHTNLHFEGGGLTLPGAQEDYVKFIYIKKAAHIIRAALLERLGIKSYDVSEPALDASPTDSSPAESKDESSEEEGSYEDHKGYGSSQD